MASRARSKKSAGVKYAYASAAEIFAAASSCWLPTERISVAEAARRYLVLDNPGGGPGGAFSFAEAPYLARPMECLTPGSGYTLVSVMGPGQCGKSTIGNAWYFAYTPIVDPADMLMLMPDHRIAHGYSIKDLKRVVSASPEIAARMIDDAIFHKQFQGCSLALVWPAAAQLRARPFPRVRIDDYDSIPEDIDGEGDALVLTSARQTRFEGFECTLVNSSPALGEERGIEGLVARGTDERWSVACLRCGARFELDYAATFEFARTGTPEEAAGSARVRCPRCMHAHTPADKRALVDGGEWVATRPGGAHASFRIDGLMGFASWAKLAAENREAEIAYERLRDEEKLKAFWNARVGKNYRLRADGAEPLGIAALEARAAASDYGRGEIPPGVLVLTAAIDVQARRFEIAVWGWGEGLECWLIDRFALEAVSVPGAAAGERVEPARKVEHWDALVDVIVRRRYALRHAPHIEVPILNVAIDTGGLGGVTDKAFGFFFRALRRGVPATSLTLVKGGNNPNARTLPPPTVDVGRQMPGMPTAELYVPNVNRIKDAIDNRLRRSEPGPGYMHMPRDVAPAHLAELVAERRREGRWELREGQRNETLDLLVYGYTALLRHSRGEQDFNWLEERARWAMVPAADEIDTGRPPPAAPRRQARWTEA